MNRVQLVGNVTREIELKQSAQDRSYVQFTVAVNRYIGGENQADFIDVAAFGKNAEILAQYGHKGSKLAINGRLKSDSYVDKNGNRHYGMKVILENFEFAGRPREEQVAL